MIYDSIALSNRLVNWITRTLFVVMVLFLILNIFRAFVNCGPWAREDTRKSCVFNQPRKPVLIGQVEEADPIPVPIPAPAPAPAKPPEERINIRMTTGTLTVSPVVRDGAGNQFAVIARIRPGDVVEILEIQEQDWIRIRMLEPILDEWTGWVRGRFREDEPKPESGKDIID